MLLQLSIHAAPPMIYPPVSTYTLNHENVTAPSTTKSKVVRRSRGPKSSVGVSGGQIEYSPLWTVVSRMRAYLLLGGSAQPHDGQEQVPPFFSVVAHFTVSCIRG